MKSLLLPSLLFLTFTLNAQSERYSIRAIVMDSTGEALPYATTMLLHPVDSTLITFGRTSEKGILEFKNLKREQYLLKINYVGYIPYQQLVSPPQGNLLDLDTILLKELNKDLMEVVVKTARAPLSIRGDTVEYNASSFKVPPGATVEDLLKRLPGMQVDQEGNIIAHGQAVRRVMVDGKRFFGDDPKAATRNLPAEAINKVQVYDSKTEEARLTGVDDGTREKTMNLELKESHRKGGFGKATVGVGTDKRAQGKVNYNKFDQKNQFALIGLGNNVNQTGLSSDDYQDFRGSQSFNWSGGEFGFGGSWDGYEGIDVNWGGNRERGYSKNWAGGANYNYETKTTKFSTYYYYNQTSQTLDGFTEKENFLDQFSYRSTDQNSRLNKNKNHRTFIRFEKELDSLNTLVVENQVRIGNGLNHYNSVQQYFAQQETPSTHSETRNAKDFDSFLINTSILFNHKFRKAGRSWALSSRFNVNNSGEEDYLFGQTLFYRSTIGLEDSLYVLRQSNETDNLNKQFRIGTMYVEPLSKRIFLETFYNFNVSNTEVERQVFDEGDQGNVPNQDLTRKYGNTFYSNRGGSRLRYTYRGLNWSVGLAFQHFSLNGNFSSLSESQPTRLHRNYYGWIPNFTLSNQFQGNLRLYVSYNNYMRLPSITDLQPVVDYSNPIFIREGNPDLLPTTYHQGYATFGYFNSGSFFNLFIDGQINYRVREVVYAQEVDENLVTYTRPVNMTGGKGALINIRSSIPIVKTKLNLRLNAGYNSNFQLTPINGQDNETVTIGFPTSVGVDFTPSPDFMLYAQGRWSVDRTRYSISSSQNQKINTIVYNAETNIRFPGDFYINGALLYNQYENSRQGIHLDQPLLNLAIYKLLLKNKRAEIRLTAFDLFNKNQGIRVYSSLNFTSREQVQTLGRYFMFSLTYNMRGVTANMRRSFY